MFTRRELLSRGTTLLLLVPILGCTTGSDSQPVACNSGLGFTSSLDAEHTHTLCVPTVDMTNPPATGTNYVTSTDGGHTHKVTLTQAQLSTINGGGTVMVASTSDNDPTNNLVHSHSFAISKAAGQNPPPPPPPGGW